MGGSTLGFQALQSPLAHQSPYSNRLLPSVHPHISFREFFASYKANVHLRPIILALTALPHNNGWHAPCFLLLALHWGNPHIRETPANGTASTGSFKNVYNGSHPNTVPSCLANVRTQKREQSYTIVRPHFTNSLVISVFREKISYFQSLKLFSIIQMLQLQVHRNHPAYTILLHVVLNVPRRNIVLEGR